MNQEITVELQLFFISVIWGGIILLAYDGLRIIRRLIKHGTFFLAVEDLIFWIFASIFIFSMIYRQNDGIIRGFSVMGMTIGMLLYHYIFKNTIVDLIVKCIRTLLRPFAIALNTIKKGILFVLLKVKKAAKFLLRQLKKIMKSVKIALNKRTQSIAAKRHLRNERKAALKRNAKRKNTNRKVTKRRQGDNHPQTEQRPEPIYKKEHAPTFERVNPTEPVRRDINPKKL